jgi:orotate phosphoribosyltransferase-like protein
MEEIRDELIEMRRKGISTDKIAETLNLSTDTVIWLITHMDLDEDAVKSPADILVDWSTIGEEPARIVLLGQMLTNLIGEKIPSEKIDAVYGLTYDGVPIAQEVARSLSKPCVIVKTQQDELEFLSPFFDPEGKQIIIVDHVINTARTLTRVVQALGETRTRPLGIFAFVDKRPWMKEKNDVAVAGIDTYSLVRAIKA